jgi:hypothetical protein
MAKGKIQMNNRDTVLAVNSTFGKQAAAGVDGLENKIKASMKAVLDSNFMTTDDDELFRAGIGGALLDVGMSTPDGQRIVASIDALKKFSAFMNAATAGLDVSLDSVPFASPDDLLPLLGWWHEVKAERSKTA